MDVRERKSVKRWFRCQFTNPFIEAPKSQGGLSITSYERLSPIYLLLQHIETAMSPDDNLQDVTLSWVEHEGKANALRSDPNASNYTTIPDNMPFYDWAGYRLLPNNLLRLDHTVTAHAHAAQSLKVGISIEVDPESEMQTLKLTYHPEGGPTVTHTNARTLQADLFATLRKMLTENLRRAG